MNQTTEVTVKINIKNNASLMALLGKEQNPTSKK